MPPPRTGTVAPHGDHFDARLRGPDGKRRRRICLPATLTHDQAKARAAHLQQLADEENAPKSSAALPLPLGAETCNAWAERWFVDREGRRGLTTVDDDRGRWKKWISPKIGTLPMRDGGVTKNDVEDIVEQLDRSVAAGDLSWKTAINVWAVLSKAFKDAVNAKTRSLRVLTMNPALGVSGPEKGAEKALQYLTPAEFLKLVGSTKVPVDFRRAVVLAVFLLVRASELVPLTWDDVDLAAGVVSVHTALDKKRQAKSTKTKKTRRVPIDPHVRPLLVEMRRECGGAGRVVPVGIGLHLARGLRRHLKRAGVARPELHQSTPTRRAIRFHDCRSTGITWHAIAGLDALKIMARSGHEDYKTMQGYVRDAEVLAAGGTFGQVFPQLPLDALGVRVDGADRAIGPERPKDQPKNRVSAEDQSGKPERETGFEPATNPTITGTSETVGAVEDGPSSPTVSDRRQPAQELGRKILEDPTTVPQGHGVPSVADAREQAAGHILAAVQALLEVGEVDAARALARSHRPRGA
jgi:integrase